MLNSWVAKGTKAVMLIWAATLVKEARVGPMMQSMIHSVVRVSQSISRTMIYHSEEFLNVHSITT
ncbi:hypothetical protein AN963_10085 [Brevibacillus choshinensis]|uniref:Uncharacterized protein n=1 Tax=Brevibacillus choshinensis TaxID=54911 RepID=A0ABR5NEN7_BRECH|nr:hypothetical protein [Brevibacillus choshinensis]KQL50000.1 hypothetical protein AN963_10085 [Brevibacillus choshinensis]